LVVESHCGVTAAGEMMYTSQVDNTAVTKQWIAKWPSFIVNAVFQIVHNHGE